MNLQRLRYFVTVAQELHFGRAAKRLHMAQPPLSQQIRLLERELDTPLLDRSTRRVSLTDAGALLYPRALRLVAEADNTKRLMHQHRDGHTGTLRIGFVDSAAYEVMPRVVHELRQRRPQIGFELHTMSSDAQCQALLAGRVDLGIARAAPTGEAQIESTQVMQEPLLVAASTSHRLASKAAVGLAELAEEPAIGFDRTVSPTLHTVLVGMLAAEGVAYDPVIEATEYTTVLGLVAAGEGIALVPASVQTFKPPGLDYVSLRDERACLALLLLSRSGEPLPLVAAALETVADLYPPTGEAVTRR